jgi:2-oxoisovalerate dehydrogenase E1 component
MYHPVWSHVPGLIVCVPSNPADAKGLMKTALRAGDPVLMLEPKALFASKGEVPTGDHLVPFGLARVARTGSDLTIACAGQIVLLALQAAEKLQQQGVSCEVIDLRTIQPLDVDTVAQSVRKTGRLLVADEGWSMCGVGAELGQAMNELAFDYLDAPVARLHTDAMSHPFAPSLERAMLVNTDAIVAAGLQVMAGVAQAPRRARSGLQRPASAAVGAAPDATVVSATRSAPASVAAATPAEMSAAASRTVAGEPLMMPFGDLTVSEGKLIRWVRQVGEAVAEGELVVEIETDKAVVEVQSPCSGTMAQHLAQEGAVVKMGEQIGVITRGGH